MKTRIGDDHLQHRAGGRIPLEDALDIFLNLFEHAVSFLPEQYYQDCAVLGKFSGMSKKPYLAFSTTETEKCDFRFPRIQMTPDH